VTGGFRGSQDMSEVPVRVWRVGRSSESRYLVVLRDDSGAVLPMTIGPCEAIAIWAVMHDRETDPGSYVPGTHDLLCALIERLGGRLTKIVIDDLWNEVYYAKLHVARDGQNLTIDARPSDSVAVALRTKAPLFVAANVLEAANAPQDESEEEITPLDTDLSDL